jgi:hypothetical protein
LPLELIFLVSSNACHVFLSVFDYDTESWL